MIARIALSVLLVPLVLTGCAAMAPTGPDVVALPPHGKSLGAFQQEDYECRSYAFNSGNGAQESSASLQAHYDAAYAQCMASKGNSIAPQTTTVYTTAPAYYAPPPVIYGGPPRFGYWAY
ncbi:MAG TPA: hypothetical protein VGG24_14325 [Paraburkholderia sp.]|jgi:hypothetical protein